jgi:hypothetical protein
MPHHIVGSLRAARVFKIVLSVMALAALSVAAVAQAQPTKHHAKHHAKHHRKHHRKHAHAARDKVAPSAPNNLTATAGDRQIALHWAASSDNRGVMGYRIYKFGTVTQRVGGKVVSVTEPGLTNGVKYSYFVRAYDRAGNVSAPSNVATATPSHSAGSGSGSSGSGTSTAPAPTSPAPTSGSGTTAPPSGTPVPSGVAGNWSLKFDDEFDGTSLDTSKWTNSWFNGGSMNGTSTSPSNVSVADGAVSLQLSNSSTGALIHTNNVYRLPVGGVAEARILFPGNGSQVYNWSAWWANSTDNWPAAGEHDIAEVLGGSLTVNYHSPSGSHNEGAPSGYWGGAYHTYTLHRKSGSVDVYWDGKLVKSYSTDDNGAPEDLVLNVGNGQGSPTMTGAAGAIKVDYVRAWQPA